MGSITCVSGGQSAVLLYQLDLSCIPQHVHVHSKHNPTKTFMMQISPTGWRTCDCKIWLRVTVKSWCLRLASMLPFVSSPHIGLHHSKVLLLPNCKLTMTST